MPEYIPHTLEGASLELDGNATRRVATGVITDIDTSNPALVLERAHEFMQQQGHILGQTYYTGSATLLLKRMRFDPLSGDAVRVTEVYDSETGISPAAYVITDRTYTTAYQTQRIPGTSEVLRVGAVVTEQAEIPMPTGFPKIRYPKPVPIPPDNVTINMLRPMREIVVNALIAGSPGGNVRDAVGCVNGDVWAGYPAGYWLLSQFASRYARYGGYRELTLCAISKIREPFDEHAILFNQKTGKYVPIDQNELAAALQEPYQFGVRRYNGFLIACPYPTVSFTPIFGFSDPDNV